jgi:hypothetical protein
MVEGKLKVKFRYTEGINRIALQRKNYRLNKTRYKESFESEHY